jgi:PAS domain S-box-containing protein
MSRPTNRTPADHVMAAARLAAIIDSSADAIISKTLDGRILSWNPAAERIFGYTAQEMIGSTIYRLVPERLHSDEAAILARIARGETVAHYETPRLHKSGKEIIISLSVAPIRDETGEIVGASSIKRDITVQRAAELALRQTTKMEAIGRLAGGLAHDFNNQLHALGGFIHFIERDPTLSPAIGRTCCRCSKRPTAWRALRGSCWPSPGNRC